MHGVLCMLRHKMWRDFLTQLLAEAGHGQESVKDRQHEDKLDSIVREDGFVN
jgi:hypothetical protein